MSLEVPSITTDSKDPFVQAQEFPVTAAGVERVKKRKNLVVRWTSSAVAGCGSITNGTRLRAPMSPWSNPPSAAPIDAKTRDKAPKAAGGAWAYQRSWLGGGLRPLGKSKVLALLVVSQDRLID